MHGPRKLLVVTACVVFSGSCVADWSVDPARNYERAEFTTFSLLPELISIEHGEEITLAPVVLNQRGYQMTPFPDIAYSTSSPMIATVSAAGVVKGVAPGTAVISARATVGKTTLRTSKSIDVRRLVISDSLFLTAHASGWGPTPARVVAGGKVEWRSGRIAVSYGPTTTVYLMSANYSIIDSLDVRGGSATRTFASPGTVRYCSNACWDPPEYGIIHVH